MSRALLLLALIAGCAVPELDRTGAIVCGTNNLCPAGFACELGRCCPADAGVSCPTLPRACVGSSTTSACLDATNLFGSCAPRGGSGCGVFECVPRIGMLNAGFCTVPMSTRTSPEQPCTTLSHVGNRCWDGKGVCVGVTQLGLDPSILGGAVACLPTCTAPAGQGQSQCGNLSVCQRLSGLTSAVCVTDCRSLGCTDGSICDRATGICRQ